MARTSANLLPRHCEKAIPAKRSGKKARSPRPLSAARNDNNRPEPRRASGWSPERRAAHAAAIRRWAPWKKSTGPKTAKGKARSSQNARISPTRLYSNPDTRMRQALRANDRYLADISLYLRLGKRKTPKNELLKRHVRNLRQRIRRNGKKVMLGLQNALLYANSCRN